MKKSPSKILLPTILLLCTSVLILSCKEETPVTTPAASSEKVQVDSLSVELKEKEEKKEPRLVVTYHLGSLSKAEDVDSFQTRYSEDERLIISALNRIDPWLMGIGSQLLVPDTLSMDFLIYSPFPEHMVILDSIPKTILISQRVQAIGLYENGKLIRWGPTSSGKLSTPTPNGLHYGNHKSKRKISTVNPDWILPYYFNFMNFEGVGVHQYAMPGYPGSHACVRLFREDASFIYNWAEQWKLNDNEQKILRNGTPFMVFGEYDFEDEVPWLKLVGDNENNFLTTAEMDTLKNYVNRYFEDERNFFTEEEELEPSI